MRATKAAPAATKPKAPRVPKAAFVKVVVMDVPGALAIFLDGLRTVNEANQRGHWSKKWGPKGRTTVHRFAAKQAVGAAMSRHPHAPPYEVKLVRRAPSGGLDPEEGDRSALKAIRDGVADALGVGDGPRDPVTWKYEQRRGSWGVEIFIAWGTALEKASGE